MGNVTFVLTPIANASYSSIPTAKANAGYSHSTPIPTVNAPVSEAPLYSEFFPFLHYFHHLLYHRCCLLHLHFHLPYFHHLHLHLFQLIRPSASAHTTITSLIELTSRHLRHLPLKFINNLLLLLEMHAQLCAEHGPVAGVVFADKGAFGVEGFAAEEGVELGGHGGLD
jgi:hypothetical protein